MNRINNKPVVKYTDTAVEYLNKLIFKLFNQDYFSFIDSAKQYVSDMKNYIETIIAILPVYPAPPYFSKYQTEMQYVTYRLNKRTTWYFFFLREDNRYLVCYITNNHFEGRYIR